MKKVCTSSLTNSHLAVNWEPQVSSAASRITVMENKMNKHVLDLQGAPYRGTGINGGECWSYTTRDGVHYTGPEHYIRQLWQAECGGARRDRYLESVARPAISGTAGNDNSQPLTLTYFSDIGETANKQWILKGVIAKGETSSWIAPPGKGKSALLIDIAIHAAIGSDWRGRRCKERCGVIYFALERADLVKRRLQAHARRDKLADDLPIAVVGQVIDIVNPACVDTIVAAIHEAQARFGLDAFLIILDTFSKGIAAGGGDEDKAKDQNRTLANLRRVQEQTGAHIAIIGHTGKDEGRGARGSNAHVGDVDVMVQLSGSGDTKVAKIIKANDQEEGELTRFKLETFELGQDEDGDAITTAIVSAEAVEEVQTKSERIPDRHKLALAALDEAVLSHGEGAPLSLLLFDVKATKVDRWKDELFARGVLDRFAKNPRTDFRRLKESMAAQSLIGERDGLVWRARTP